MVADADPEIGRRLTRFLCAKGHRALYASCGEEVLRRARSGRVELVIVDPSLEDMSGPALAARLTAMDPTLHVLVWLTDRPPNPPWVAAAMVKAMADSATEGAEGRG